MTIMESAYIAALEKKLIEAERALYGFRCIFNNYTSQSEAQAGTKGEHGPSRDDWEETGSTYVQDPECVE